MTQLLVDIGNSRIKWALLRGTRLGRQQVAPRDEFARFEHWLRSAPRLAQVHAVCVAGAGAERQLRAALKRCKQPAPQFARSSTNAAGVTNGYREAWRLGADRWVAAIGAWHLAGASRATCAVDVGTALTVDLVDETGQHRGGLIAPGPQLMVRSLLGNTGGIAARAAAKPRPAAGGRIARPSTVRPLADNTLDAIELGSLLAAVALIDRCVHELQRSLGKPPLVFLTGGAAKQLAPVLGSAYQSCDDLVLRGLAVLATPAGTRKA
jgi:type III pantothenate kinase